MRIGNMMQIVFFIGFLGAGASLMHFFHGTGTSSDTENRALAPLPTCTLRTVLTSHFFRQLENYAADHIGFRDSLVSTSKFITSFQGIVGRESPLIVLSNSNNSAEAQPALPAEEKAHAAHALQLLEPSSIPEHDDPVLKLSPEEKGKVQGRVLVLGDRAMNLFSYDAAAGQAYADAINELQARLDQVIPDQIQASVLLAPTAVEFIESAKLKSLSDPQRKAIDEVYGKISGKVTKIDALSSMSSHKEAPLFFRTDHHWTADGAYYAYAAYIEAKGMKPVPLTDYSTGEVPDFLGSLYSSTLNRQLAAHPDKIVYYKPAVKHQYTVHYTGSMQMPLIDLSHAAKKNKYRIFLSGDRPWAHIATETGNNRRVAVIKDSYGNALVPFLLPHYSDIFVIDPRQFDQSLIPFIQKHNIQEILYANNAEVTTDRDFAKQLRKLAHDR